MLSYEEFLKLVPKETATFINHALPYLNYYEKDSKTLYFRKTDRYTPNYYSKFFFLMLYAMTKNPTYEAYFSKYEFDRERIKIDKEKIIPFVSEEDLYNSLGSIIPNYEDKTIYEFLTPIDIFLPILEGYWHNNSQDTYKELFVRNNNFSDFRNDLIEFNASIKFEQERKLEQNLYGNLPVNVINFLETASKIRTLLYKKLSNKKNDIYMKREEDITSLSLLLAIYSYKDTPIYIEENIGEQSAIKSLLTSKGITEDKILQCLGISISPKEVIECPKNLISIKKFFINYCKDGICSEKEEENVNVRSVLQNTFNREFTKSVAIEKLFAKLNYYVGMFNNFEESVNQYIEIERRNYSSDYVKSFYNDLPRETKEFANFTAKIYILLLQKMKTNKHNTKLLFGEDDADTLALLIATYYYNGDVSEFFKDYGITLDKILKLLNISLNKKEIEDVSLNQKILVDRYKRFFYDGINRNKNSNNLTINDIAHNLCSREFNRSMIMEEIFSLLTEEDDLQSDFLNQMQKHLEQKEKERKRKLTQKLFHDMPVETIEFLENVSRIHQYLSKTLIDISKEDIKAYALILSIFKNTTVDIQDFFKYLGFDLNKICSYLNISSKSLLDKQVDIDLLYNEYGSYIFGGKNKDKKREELTPLEISKNIFSKELNNSINISKFLAHFNQSYKTFENFDEIYHQFEEDTKEEKAKKEAENLVNSYHNAYSYLINVFKIYQLLERQIKNGDIKPKYIQNIDDLKEAAMVLALFKVENSSKKFFEKNNITKDNVLSICGLQEGFLDYINDEEIDYVQGISVFAPYFSRDNQKYNSRRNINDFINRIFDISLNRSLFLENIAAQVGANYDILKEEVETGKNYELLISMSERISLLENEPIDVLDLNDIKSVLHFGNSLSIHSKYIHDELPRLMLSDENQNSIDTINSIINRIYIKTDFPKNKQSLFSRLFSISVDEEKPKYELNPSAIRDLKNAIDKNITTLSNEILGYDAIRKYIEVYIKKNRSHYIVSAEMVKKIEEELKSLSPQIDKQYSKYLTTSSQLQIMTDKTNRFATTNQLMQQELLKVSQAIVNHFITINSLEMARDDLLPLVGSELALNQRRSTENESLGLSHNVIGLFQSLLERNVVSAVENIEQLKKIDLPQDIFVALNKDIEGYLKNLNQADSIEEEINHFDIDKMENSIVSNAENVLLTYTPNSPNKNN